ncbi:transposase [Streptomyces erythrochromogenes]|uniref:transposase n=1 Tax=Streptomyces erythrochromogenes TaxID=285574 RepID=UPI0036FA2EE0
MPSIGGVRNGARNLIEVGDGSTFPTAGHLAAYAGIAPATRRVHEPSRTGSSGGSPSSSWSLLWAQRDPGPPTTRKPPRPCTTTQARLLRDSTAEAARPHALGRGACGFAWGTTSSRTGWGGVLTPPGHGCRVEQLPGAETLGSSPHMDSLSSGDTRLFIRESKPGKSGGKLLIESEPPERET